MKALPGFKNWNALEKRIEVPVPEPQTSIEVVEEAETPDFQRSERDIKNDLINKLTIKKPFLKTMSQSLGEDSGCMAK